MLSLYIYGRFVIFLCIFPKSVEKIEEVVHHIGTINWSAVIVGCVCLAVLIIWPMLPGFLKKIPGSLVALFVGIFMVSVLKMEVKTICELYTIK